MRLLVDESLAGRVASLLSDAGHDVVHVSDQGLLGASDDAVLAAAQQEGRVVVTADTDFGTLLALGGIAQTSVVLLRRPGRRAEQRAEAVIDAISAVSDVLNDGALVVVEPNRVRVRMLPFDEA